MIKTLKNARFMPLLGSHLFESLNDNLIRNIFVFLTAYHITGGSLYWLIVAFCLYGGAFLIMAAFSGPFADKFGRTFVIRRLKLFEIAVTVLAMASAYFESRLMMLGTLTLMGACTAFDRVIKYAITPELVSEKELLGANAVLKGSTFFMTALTSLAFLFWIPEIISLQVLALSLLVFSIAGYLNTQLITPDTPADSSVKLFRWPRSLLKMAVLVDERKDLTFYISSIAWHWILGSVLVLFASDYAEEVLHSGKNVLLFLTIIFSVGYVVGSVLSVWLCNKKGWKSLAPVSAVLMSVFFIDFTVASFLLGAKTPVETCGAFFSLGFHAWQIAFDAFAMGLLAACFIIPFYPLLQKHTPNAVLGRVLGFTTVVCSLAVMGTVAIVMALKILQISILFVFLGLAVVNLFFAIYTAQMIPPEKRRKMMKKVLTFFFNIDVKGLENVGKAGKKALIIANHTSYLDAMIISAFIDKQITFSVPEHLAKKWWVRFCCNLIDIKPLNPNSPSSVRAMVKELNKNKLCMIFPEGLIQDGNTRMQIYEAPALMAQKAGASILPIQLKGSSHTVLSRVKYKTYTEWHPDIEMKVLPPVKFKLKKGQVFREVREQIASQLYDILSDMAFETYNTDQTVFEASVRAMKTVGRNKLIWEDAQRKPMKFKAIFMRAFALGAIINRATKGQKQVGLMLPTSNMCALSILGLFAYGKTPKMINFTSGVKAFVSTCKTVGLKTVVTARKAVTLAKLEPLIEALEKNKVKVLYLEDLAKTLTLKDKLFAVKAMLNPMKAYRKTAPDVKPEDAAFILFTSGSEGLPKAVLLSHKNVISNTAQVLSRLDIGPKDVMFVSLPLFHSFGIMGGIVLPLVTGMKAFFYPTPLHYRIIPELCSSVKATILFSTDTFLTAYAKCANVYDFNTLRVVAAGAEKLRDETRRVWAERFGIRIIEGYGATECAPILSVNTFLHARNGSVGRILTGMTTKLKPVPGIKDGAELVVKGPNVMMGYMKHDKPGVLQPPKNGWYETGDIVHIDEEGYIFIKGRSKRFAKIGGEMVSLLAVEETIRKAWKDALLGVVSIPDAKKGEQVVLITNDKNITKEKMIEVFKNAGMTELSIPKTIIVTDNPPLLGTGKFDYVTAKEMALKETA